MMNISLIKNDFMSPEGKARQVYVRRKILCVYTITQGDAFEAEIRWATQTLRTKLKLCMVMLH